MQRVIVGGKVGDIAIYRMAKAGIAIAAVLTLIGIFGPALAPHDSQDTNIAARLCPPTTCEYGGAIYWLGTDHLGRDVLSRITESLRTHFYIGIVGTFLGFTLAWSLVIVRSIRRTLLAPSRESHLFGVSFWVLAILVYVTGLFVSLMSLSMFGPSFVMVIVHAGLFSAILPLSLIRVRGREHASDGPDSPKAVRRGISMSLVCFCLAFLMGLLLESSLSFVGLGVPSPHLSLGVIIRGVMIGNISLAEAPWVWGFPLGIILTAMAALSAVVYQIQRDGPRRQFGKIAATE